MAEPLVIEINQGATSVTDAVKRQLPSLILPSLIWLVFIAAVVKRAR